MPDDLKNFANPIIDATGRCLLQQTGRQTSSLKSGASRRSYGGRWYKTSTRARSVAEEFASTSNATSSSSLEKFKTAALISLPLWVYLGLQSNSEERTLQMESSGAHAEAPSATTMAALQLIKDPLAPLPDANDFDSISARMERDQTDSTEHRHEAPVYRIVLTGGPCGGKSTAMSHLSDRLKGLGFRVFCVPEAASLLITGIGMVPPMLPEHEHITFEGTLLRTKIALEDTFTALARASKRRSVVLCDRGTMDTRAYLDKETFDLVLSEFGWNIVELRDRRYDGVVHLVTAAIGAPHHYGTENNTARHESLEQAAELDCRVLEAWVGHPRIRIVDNTTDWNGKLTRVLDAVCQFVGAPRPNSDAHKFVLENWNPEELRRRGINVESFTVDQTYLHKERSQSIKGYTYLRRRGQNGSYTYTLSSTGQPRPTPAPVGPDGSKLPPLEGQHGQLLDQKSIILERSINGREFLALLRQSDSRRLTVKKQVYCFIYENNYYEIHEFRDPDIRLTILNTDAAKGTLPPFLAHQAVDVSGRKEFSSYFISKHFQRKEKRTRDWRADPKYSKYADFTKTSAPKPSL